MRLLIILLPTAIGQHPDVSLVEADSDLRLTSRGLIECDANDLTTSAPDVFVAGDIAHGARLLIDAVASGKRSARAVYRYVSGHNIDVRQVVLHLPIIDYQREADYEQQRLVAIPTFDAAERRQSPSSVVERGYSPEMAICEAGRCLDCGINTIFDSDKCVLCGGCADMCPELCLRLVSVSSLKQTGPLQAVFDARFSDGEEASAIIKEETRCIRCGLCAQRCPVGAITMETMTFCDTWTEAPQ